MKTIEIFLTLALHHNGTWYRVGKPKWSLKDAKDWLPFVRGVTRRRCRVKRVVLPIVSPGKTTPEAAKMMSEKYLIDVDS